MTIKHSISKIQWAIVWALNYYLTQLSSSPRSSCQWNSRLLETSCGREGHTRPRGPSGTPMEWTPASGEQERHDVTVITVGSRYYNLCSVSSSLSYATLEQPFRTLAIKWEVNIFVKKSSCVFVIASVLIIVSLWCCRWLYNISLSLSLSLRPYHPTLPTVPSDFIQCLHRAYFLVGQPWCVYV